MRATKRASGALLGLAFGDALGARTEFLSLEEIVLQFPPAGPTTLDGSPALVTDDTQMALAVGEALLEAPRQFTTALLEPILRRRLVEWRSSPENTRVPGNTCLEACARLEQATVAGSKGCGANMRVAPVGLLPAAEPGMTATSRAALAQFQAAMTHGHPTALAAADLTAMTVSYLAGGRPATASMTSVRLPAQVKRRGRIRAILCTKPLLPSSSVFSPRCAGEAATLVVGWRPAVPRS